MDEETKKILIENLEVAKENNHMLRRLVRAQRWSTVYRVIYWIIIIGITFGSFYFIEPYLGSISKIVNLGGATDINSLKNITKNLNLSQ